MQQAVIDQPQHHKGHAPAQHPQADAAIGHPPAALLGERKRERDARNKEEEGENQVVLCKTVPDRMRHLPRKPFSNLGRATSVQSDHPRGKPHDKQHVESPQGIQRQQSFFSLRVHIPTLFYMVYRQRHRFIQPNRAKKQSGRSTPTVVSSLRSISQRDTRYPFAISYTARSFRGPR